MSKIRFVAKVVDDQAPLPGSGVDVGEKEISIGVLDIEDKTVLPVLTALQSETPKGTSIEAWKKDDSGYWTLIAKKSGK